RHPKQQRDHSGLRRGPAAGQRWAQGDRDRRHGDQDDARSERRQQPAHRQARGLASALTRRLTRSTYMFALAPRPSSLALALSLAVLSAHGAQQPAQTDPDSNPPAYTRQQVPESTSVFIPTPKTSQPPPRTDTAKPGK